MSISARSSWLRAWQAFGEEVCRKETLSSGIAFYAPAFPNAIQANQFREVIYEDERAVERAFDEAEAFFAGKGLICRAWAPAVDHDPAPLDDFLVPRGFVRQGHVVLRLTSWPSLTRAEGVRILPARAARAAFLRTFETEAREDALGEGSAELFAERLDDPRLDMFVAMREGLPVGRGGLFQVGDIGVITALHATGRAGDRADPAVVEQALLDHLLMLAQRLQIPNILVRLPSESEERRDRFTASGFEVEGELAEFIRAS